MLHIDVLGSCLTFGIFYEDNIGFVVFMKYVGIYRVCNPQFVKKSLDPHTFTGRVPQSNVFGFGGGGGNGALLFAAPGD